MNAQLYTKEYRTTPNFGGSRLSKNHMNVNFRDRYVFRDYLSAAAPARTIHVVAPPTIFMRGVGACKCEVKRIEITLSRFEF